MAYLCLKKRGKYQYYIIRESLRKKGKTYTKDIKYLGKDISKLNLSEIEKEFGTKIKKAIMKNIVLEYRSELKENKYFNKKQMAEIDVILNDYQNKFIKLPKEERKKILDKFKIRFTTENVAVDYLERLAPPKTKETEKIIQEKIFPRNKSLAQIWRLINTTKIFGYLKTEPRINLKFLEKLSNLFSEAMSHAKGFRKHEIKNIEHIFKPSKVNNIKTDLRKLMKWFNKEKTKIPSLALVVLFHHKFEKIRPFYTGNGEIGRIIMNYQFSKLGYPPIIITKKTKEEYYKTMNKAYPCLKKDLLSTDMKYYKDLIDFMQKQFVKTYWDNFVV